MSQWNDMSSAPRDGTRILLSRRQGQIRPLKRMVVIGCFRDLDGADKWVAETSTYHRESDFNGWMPLPRARP